MIDASASSIVVYEFAEGRACEVGGKDKPGTIVIPGKVG